MSIATPYRTTPVFDRDTLPAALQREHRTKNGVWGIIRVLEGRLALEYFDGTLGLILAPATPGFIKPEQPHLVRPEGPFRMQVEFYDCNPAKEAKVP
jgi:tellurite resistance-related uncharacterized protein